MKLHAMLQRIASFFKKKKYRHLFILGLFAILLLITVLIYLWQKGAVSPIATDMSWQIGVSYSSKTKDLAIKNINILPVSASLDDRAASLSPYTAEIDDRNGNALYRIKIQVNETIHVDYISSTIDPKIVPVLPNDFATEVFLPYTKSGETIVIKRQGKIVAKKQLPKKLSLNLDTIAYAQTPLSNVGCGPLQIVFINDNYSNTSQFQSDVQYLENLYNNTAPYNVSPSVFDFKEIDDPQHFECGNDLFSCYERTFNASLNVDTQTSPFLLAKSRFPGAQKVVIITDSSLPDSGGVAGITGGPGANVVMYTNYAYGGKRFATATHELLGHAIGYLYDRYVINQEFANSKNLPNYGYIAPDQPRSNCTDNPRGENGWPGAFPGCANHTNYAPAQLNCDVNVPENQRNMDNGGNTSTVMSATDCAQTTGFDQTEQAWIRSRIVSQYQKSCATPTPRITITPSPTPSPTTQQTIVHSIRVNTFIASSHSGFSGATVFINGPVSLTKTTDSSGIATFPNLPDGTYTVRLIIGTSQVEKTITFTQKDVSAEWDIPIQINPTATPQPGVSIVPLPTTVQIINTTPTIVPLPSSTPQPTTTPSSSTPVNTSASSDILDYEDVSPVPVIASGCYYDPQCTSSQKNLQLCQLICPTGPFTPPVRPTSVPATPVPTTASVPVPTPGCPATQPLPNIGSIGCPVSFLGENTDCFISPDPSCPGLTIAHGGKPVIYLYPTKTTPVNVSLTIPGIITISDPHYDFGGWKNVEAHTDGSLFYQGKTYKELYYEFDVPRKRVSPPSSLLILPHNDLAHSLYNVVKKLGLKDAEAKEFINYWMPKLDAINAPYIAVGVFSQEKKDQIDHVDISPKPDTFLQLLVYFKPRTTPIVDEPFVYPQVAERKGFTAVEWGGIIGR